MLDWSSYIKVADRFKYKAKHQDREDLRGDIILKLAEVELKYNGNGETLSEGGMIRVASYVVMQYWRDLIIRATGVDCSRCGKALRERCRGLGLYAECPKRISVVSCESEVEDGEGDVIRLIDTIADDNALDVDKWLDDKEFLYHFPIKLVRLAYKRVNGEPLTHTERHYLYRHSKKARKEMCLV